MNSLFHSDFEKNNLLFVIYGTFDVRARQRSDVFYTVSTFCCGLIRYFRFEHRRSTRSCGEGACFFRSHLDTVMLLFSIWFFSSCNSPNLFKHTSRSMYFTVVPTDINRCYPERVSVTVSRVRDDVLMKRRVYPAV